MEFETVIQTLTDARVEFVLIGGVSAQLQGSALLTYDVEDLAAIPELEALLEALED